MELSANSELVKTLKSGKRLVTDKSLKEKYGQGKSVNVRETKKDLTILARYRDSKKNFVRPPLSHEVFADEERTPEPDWDELVQDVTSLPVGAANAGNYERAIKAFLTAVFYPAVVTPKMQTRIHEDRKRIDLTYTNIAKSGFFDWLVMHNTAPIVFVECKNYSDDPANPEIDQLSGRFSQNRGRFGILVCRNIANRQRLDTRCKDTANDGRGFMITLDDSDLKTLATERKADVDSIEFSLLRQKFNFLIM